MTTNINQLVKYASSDAAKPVIDLLSDGLYLALTIVIIPFSKKIFKETYGRYKAKKDVKERAKTKKIRQLFRDDITKFGFDRVLFLEIHNGVRTLSGLSLKKMTCTVEEPKNLDTPLIENEIQAVKLIGYDRYIDEFQANPLMCSENVLTFPDKQIKASMDLKGIKSFFVYFVTDRFNLPFGWVRYEMLEDRIYTAKEKKEIIASIELLADKIAYIRNS